jgi:membrane-bound lytic murein transglycosylase MltF
VEPEPQDQTGDTELVGKVWTGDLDGMLERRAIRALVPYSKTFYFLDGGTQRGIAYDYMKAFEDDLNARRKTGNLRVHVVFIPTTRDKMLEQLNGGRGDVAVVDATILTEGLALADYTTPIATGIKEIVVTGPASPPIANLDDLAGKTVYVRLKSSRELHLRALSDHLVARGLKPIDVQLAASELEPEDMLEMVNAGLLPAVVVNRYYGDFWKQVFTDIVVREDLVISDDNDVGFGMRKDSPQLKAELDAFLAKHRKGTEFGNVTLQKYLKSTKWVKNAASEAERAKFRDLAGLFRKYSDEYGVDWVLMAAQGYQESRLDQTVKSPVGAIGVMQVMPATAKEMNVGDATVTENNIRAGIKYIRFVMDQYYKDEPMDQKNKMLFAFASYNAGPARVRGLRKEAEARGLDPNVWFNNVEYVAAEKIGRETVTYVSNIYKYYIAYSLVNEQAEARKQAKGEGN